MLLTIPNNLWSAGGYRAVREAAALLLVADPFVCKSGTDGQFKALELTTVFGAQKLGNV